MNVSLIEVTVVKVFMENKIGIGESYFTALFDDSF